MTIAPDFWWPLKWEPLSSWHPAITDEAFVTMSRSKMDPAPLVWVSRVSKPSRTVYELVVPRYMKLPEGLECTHVHVVETELELRCFLVALAIENGYITAEVTDHGGQ